MRSLHLLSTGALPKRTSSCWWKKNDDTTSHSWDVRPISHKPLDKVLCASERSVLIRQEKTFFPRLFRPQTGCWTLYWWDWPIHKHMDQRCTQRSSWQSKKCSNMTAQTHCFPTSQYVLRMCFDSPLNIVQLWCEGHDFHTQTARNF